MLGFVSIVIILIELMKLIINRLVPKTESPHEKRLIKLLEKMDAKITLTVDGNTKLIEMHDVKDEEGRYVWYGYSAMAKVETLLTEIKNKLCVIAKAVDVTEDLAIAHRMQAEAVTKIAEDMPRYHAKEK